MPAHQVSIVITQSGDDYTPLVVLMESSLVFIGFLFPLVLRNNLFSPGLNGVYKTMTSQKIGRLCTCCCRSLQCEFWHWGLGFIDMVGKKSVKALYPT